MRTTSRQFWNDCLAGLTIFFTIAYVAFVNPVILSSIGVPTGAAFVGTCLVAGLGSIACGLWAKTPTAMAPGMAFNVFVVSYAKLLHLEWQALLLVCAGAGLIMFLLSATGARQMAISAIPIPLRLAVIGGIGAILTDDAIKTLYAPGSSAMDGHRVGAFMAGIVVIVSGYIVLRSYAEKLKDRGSTAWAEALDLIGRASFLLSIVIAATIARLLHVSDNVAITQVEPLVLLSQLSSSTLTHAFSPVAIPLLMFLVYMLTADIAGTPFQLLDRDDPERNGKVTKSFLIDSAANVVGPLLCTSPTVYYAENNAAKVVGGQTGAVAIWTGAGFLVLLAVGAIVSATHASFFQFLPQIAVAPALFCVGLLIIGAAFGRSDAEAMEPGASAAWSEGDSLPAAITIVLTPSLGLEYGLAAGLVAYFAYYVIAPARRANAAPERRAPLVFLFVFAVVAVLLKLMVLADSP